MVTRAEVLSFLSEVQHPGQGDRTLVELGLVENILIEENKVSVTLVFPKRPDPLKTYLEGAARAALYRHLPGGTEIEIQSVTKAAPPKKQEPELTLENLNSVRHIIGVASGKGGVGKSTVAVNLAIALARQGYKVGLVDADVYGPSVPLMTGTEGAVPGMERIGEKDMIVPIEKYGVKWISVGYFAKPGQALIWRGPMACSTLKQLVLQVKWDVLDYLLIDMPPGTGDIHISLVQEVPMEGAVIVTTPQEVALADVEKGVDMFRHKNINRQIVGIVENMAWFTPEAHPEEKYYLFGNGGGARMAERFGVPLLGQIPLVQSIREGGDAGEPAALGSRPDSLAFLDLAARVVEKLG